MNVRWINQHQTNLGDREQEIKSMSKELKNASNKDNYDIILLQVDIQQVVENLTMLCNSLKKNRRNTENSGAGTGGASFQSIVRSH